MPRIPKILHYVFGMASDFGGKPWSLVHHVCLKSAVERIKPDQVFLYYEYEPTGPWWKLSQSLVTLVKIAAPREIFGRPLAHVAHQADVVRLQKLIEHGGIYLDADVLVQRSFDDLLDHSTVLGLEGKSGEWGLANAVILAEPQAPFLKRWLAEYKTFRSKGRDEFWNEHSVHLPSQMARKFPTEITVLSHKAFYWPLWTDEHLKLIFESANEIPQDETYANHLWEAKAWPYLEDLTPGKVRSFDTNFHRWASPFLAGLPEDYGGPTLGRRLKKTTRKAGETTYDIGRKVKNRTIKTIRKVKRLAMSPSDARRDIFSEIYDKKLWGSDQSSRFFSGVGSRGEAVGVYVSNIVKLIKQDAERLGRPVSVVDLGCGDFQVGQALVSQLPGITYIGCDIVPELIDYNGKAFGSSNVRFELLDIVSGELPKGDICLVRQVLQHLSNREIASFLERQDYAYLYITEGHPNQRTGSPNPDKLTGADVRFDWQTGKGRGVELDQAPFNCVVEEVCRTTAPPHEIIITSRVTVGSKAAQQQAQSR
jgi:hypothetical protein